MTYIMVRHERRKIIARCLMMGLSITETKQAVRFAVKREIEIRQKIIDSCW